MHAKAVVHEQLGVVMSLADAHLRDLDEAVLHWKPTPTSWGVEIMDGAVVPDWVEPEPDDIAPPTLAWQLWHVQWWMEMALDSSFGEDTLTRQSFVLTAEELSFEALVGRFEMLRGALAETSEADWDVPLGSGFPYRDGRSFGLIAGWMSLEFTKCVADMVKTQAFAAVARP